MADCSASKEIILNASPEAVFKVVGDLTKHAQLAGSGEVKVIRKIADGPGGLGTVVEADEAITMGDETMEFSAKSVVVSYDAPSSISWMPLPPVPIRRVQWWFNITPEGNGSKVTNEVEVDLGEGGLAMFGSLDNYNVVRVPDIIKGVEQTLQNLKSQLGG